MNVQIAPEDILWQHLANCLAGHPERELRHREYFDRLPMNVEWSEEFVALWKKTVAAAVGREAASTFGFRPFLFLEKDQVVHATTLEDRFWREAPLVFSHRAVLRLWEDLVGRRQGKPPVWQEVTPADALFLSIADPRLTERFDFDWLSGREAPWLVVALFLHRWSFYNPTGLPWKIYLEQPQKVPLPLRDLLIEHTAGFFQALAFAIHRFTQVEAARGLTLEKPGHRRVRFFFEHTADILRLSAGSPFSIDTVRKAVAFWTGEGTLGFDDARFLEGAVERHGLFTHIESFQREARSIAEIGQAGGINEPQTAPRAAPGDLDER